MHFRDSVLSLVGRTPLVRLARVAAGCALAAAIRFGSQPGNSGKVVLVVLPDTGRNYLSKIFDDGWMKEKGLARG